MPSLADVLIGFETFLSGPTAFSLVGTFAAVSLVSGLVIGVIDSIKSPLQRVTQTSWTYKHERHGVIWIIKGSSEYDVKVSGYSISAPNLSSVKKLISRPTLFYASDVLSANQVRCSVCDKLILLKGRTGLILSDKHGCLYEQCK